MPLFHGFYSSVSTRRSLVVHHAPVTLPADLDYFAILDEDGHGALPPRDLTHAAAGHGIGLNVVFDELAALPFQPVAHFAGVGTACCTKKFKLGHAPAPPTIHA